jgi:hypothetical protein
VVVFAGAMNSKSAMILAPFSIYSIYLFYPIYRVDAISIAFWVMGVKWQRVVKDCIESMRNLM